SPAHAARGALARDDAMGGLHARHGGDAELAQDGFEDAAEGFERLGRVVDVGHLQVLGCAVADVVEAARGRPGAGRFQPPECLLVLLARHARHLEVDDDRHDVTSLVVEAVQRDYGAATASDGCRALSPWWWRS